ncbi:MAG: hypothetical protein H8E64_05905 [Candidatus Marinimicrobia bacterium]|nr:hypothetical protein [Candidatus Neomarinimicrobiota bacterium]
MKNNTTFWKTLLGLTAILFLIVGLPKIFIDHEYLQGFPMLITTVVFGFGYIKILKGEIVETNTSLNTGFIFLAISLGMIINQGNIGIGFWGFSIVLFLSGLFGLIHTKRRENE